MNFTMYAACPICGCLHDDGMHGEGLGFFCMDCADRLPGDWRGRSLKELRKLLGFGAGQIPA